MTAAKALGAGVFGIFADDILTVVTAIVHAAAGSVDATVQAAAARLIVGALAAAVTYYIPNAPTVVGAA